ncbi:opine metallophore biosynthesis dehydrogenase, partial [Staphylococcus epidermidis]|uniref:opine metallophore biosynthesis dehydrogenase n=2 Tax=Staphylococcus TaxID=1279 RepID=UPI0030C0B564
DTMHIPRMPSEDSYRTSIIQAIGRSLGVQTPMIDQFLARYRAYCESYQTQHPHQRVSTQFDPHAYDKDIDLVNQFLKEKHS